jgi:amidase
LAGVRAADARIVGKANLHELALLPIGTNPLDPALIPGGSSSGSAVAVATDEADVALGSDTGGSIRIPSACCGTAGLKTTYGRVSLDGVFPLAPSLDTVGPMAASVSGLVLGMQLLEPGFQPAPGAARVVGRLRTAGDPLIEAAVDRALAEAEFEVVPLDWSELGTGANCFATMFFNEMWDVDHALIEDHPSEVGDDIHQAVTLVDLFRPGLETLQGELAAWRTSLQALFDQVELLALPTLPMFPPSLEDVAGDASGQILIDITGHVAPFNAAGVPCSAQPVPVAGGRLPGSLELVGPHGAEELLLTTAAVVEAAIG